MPGIIVEALGRISEDLPNDLATDDEDDGDNVDDDLAPVLD